MRLQLPDLRPARWRELREARATIGAPMAVEPQWLNEFVSVALSRDPTRLRALRFGWASAVQSCEVEQGVGIIAIRGVLLEGSWIRDYSDIAEAVNALAADASVHSILLDIDSPGGSVHGALFGLADRIREVRAEKPVWAIAEGQACSAAYVIAAQASKIYASNANTSILGSLGVIAKHVDYSKWNEKQGFAITEIASGRHKTDLSEDKPLSKDGRATLERIVEGAFVELIDAVSAGRKVLTDEKIRAQEAAIYLGGEAQQNDLVDGIAARGDLVEKLVKKAQGQGVLILPGAAAPGSNADDGSAEEEATMADPTNQPGAGAPAPTPDPAAAAAAAAPAPGAQVIDLDAERARARGEGDAQRAALTRDIGRLCNEGGVPNLTADLASEAGMTLDRARERIQAARVAASGQEIRTQHDPTGLGARAQLDPSNNPLLRAVDALVAGRTATK
jgi:capsid assembly protease